MTHKIAATLATTWLSLTASFATAATYPIVSPESTAASERWAAQELSTFLHEIYSGDSFPVVSKAPEAGDYILLTSHHNEDLIRAHIPREDFDEPGEFTVTRIESNGQRIGIICGNRPDAVRDGVYSLLEQKLGYGFYLYRDAAEAVTSGTFDFEGWDLVEQPIVGERVIFNWYNFISGVTTWNLEDYKHWIRQAARMRHTDVMLHAYGWAPFTEFTHNGVTKEVEYLQNTALGEHWMIEHTDDVRELIGGEVFIDEGPIFGAEVSKVGHGGITEANRVAKAKAMLREAIDYAVNTVGLEFNWALDIDTIYGNPQNIILTLPESARFPVGDLWLPRPDTEPGYQLFRSMIQVTMDDFPAITKITLWSRNSRSKSFGGLTTGMERKDLPADWQALYDDAPAEAQTKYAAGHIYHAEVAKAFRRALDELDHGNVQLGYGSWWREDPAGNMVSDNFIPANYFMPSDLTCYPLDYYMVFGDKESFRQQLARIAATRDLVLIEWAHHDDGGHLGRPYQPPVDFAEKLVEIGAHGYGVIHWMNRPLDIFFKNLQNQVWTGTLNEPLQETTARMALDFFGTAQADIMADYLYEWMTTAPRFGRETGPGLGADSSTKSNSNVENFQARAADCERRIAILDQVDTTQLTPRAREAWAYLRGHEEWIRLFHLAQENWDPELQEQTIRKYVETITRDGGPTRGEMGILVQHNLKWLGLQPESQVIFQDSMTGDWREQWFLDGEKATVKNTDEGLFFSGGPVTKMDDPEEYHAHHAVLWTKDVFEGDIRISYEMTRVDESNYGNTLLYIHAQGIGTPPYTEDIAEWSDLRTIPNMGTYFTYMDLLSLSYRNNLRNKRYPWRDENLEWYPQRGLIEPMVDYIGMVPGKTYRVIAEKRGKDLRLKLFDAESGEEYLDHTWDTTRIDPSIEPRILNKGRIGLRHMATKQFIYKDFKVEQL